MPQTIPFDIGQNYKYGSNPNAPLDWWYGPYDNIADAKYVTRTTINAMTQESQVHRYKGMTVGIYNATGGVDEYWFRDGIEDDDLIPKIPDIEIPEFPTIDELLAPIKIVKFITKAQNQHQNSELTDGSGYIHLPEPTCTNGTKEFLGWGTTPTESSTTYNVGDNVDVSDTTEPVFYAIWSDMNYHTITWADGDGYTITCTSSSATVSNGDSVAEGSSVTFTCQLNPGYTFVSWNISPTPTTSGQTATVSNISSSVTASCAVQAITNTVSWTDGTGYSITAMYYDSDSVQHTIINGTTLIPYGAMVVFTCNLLNNYNLDGWNGLNGASTSGNTATISSLTTPISGISCNVSESSYNVSVSSNNDSYGTAAGGGTFNYNTTASVTATPVSNLYKFVNWTENGNEVSTNATYTFTVTRTRILVANFAPKETYAVAVTVSPEEGGSVEGDGEYIEGTNATLTVSVNSGYHFVRWTENGTQVSTNTIYTITVNSDRTLVAVFEADSPIEPDTVNVIVLSGAMPYANPLQNSITSGSITSTPLQMTSGSEQTISVNRTLDNDVYGLVLLTPANCTVNYIKLFDPIPEELGPNIQVQHGIRRSFSDDTIVTKFTLNGVEYDGLVKYTGDNPTTAKILLTIE